MGPFVPRVCAALACAALLTSCQSGQQQPQEQVQSPADASTHTSTASPREASESKGGDSGGAASALKGQTIAIDPGHNGGNATHLREIRKLVPDGNGGTKVCNTTGTATADGFEEHAFNWNVAQFVKADLEAAGAKVVLSRSNDTGVGPCVDERGEFAAAKKASLLVSIHANGSPSTATRGFGVIVAPKGSEVKRSKKLGADLVTAFKAADFPVNSSSYGKDGINQRTDLAGLMNATVPAALVECGEMNNSAEAKAMKSASGQRKYAQAIVEGVGRYLARS